MRLSQLFGRTLREDPAEAEIISHRLLQRAGFIKPSGFRHLHPNALRLARLQKDYGYFSPRNGRSGLPGNGHACTQPGRNLAANRPLG